MLKIFKLNDKIIDKVRFIVATVVCTGAMAMTVSAWTGSGTQASPYLITNKTELSELSTNVNGGNSYSGKYFELTDDVDLSDGWTPIGNATTKFRGFFDGDGHSIKNMKVSGSTYDGLFGTVDTGATICHLTLDGGSVTTSGIGGGFIGEVFGSEKGTVLVYDCVNESCSVVGTSTDKTGKVGGIVGAVSITSSSTTNSTNIVIEYCENNANVYASTTGVYNVGGIAGFAEGTSTYEPYIRFCKNSGKIGYNGSTKANGGTSGTGGIIGRVKNGDVYNCINIGSVYGGSVDGLTGGICGNAVYTSTYITRCYNSGNVEIASGNKYAGGIAGTNTAEIEACYSATVPTGGSYLASIVGKMMSSGSSSGISITNCYYNEEGSYTVYLISGTTATAVTKNTAKNVIECGQKKYASAYSTMNSLGTKLSESSAYVADESKVFADKTVTLKLVNGTSTQSVSVVLGDEYALETPEKSGYTFDGWYTTETDGMHKIENGDIARLSLENTEGRTLYARWTASGTTSSVTYTKADAANMLKEIAANDGIATYNKNNDVVADNKVDMLDVIGVLKKVS